ncbi:MAG: DUF2188 domain-containing protein [Pyrinomonadaceae bacterium]|nr:DUF2188 domain-containing protein [Pyrinomonadaceae bacterium]
MAKSSYHVIAKSDGAWSVKRTGAERASGNYPTKAAAVTSAKRLVSKEGGGELIIHGKDGRVSSRSCFGNEPEPAGERGNLSCVGDVSRSVKS